MVDRYVRGLRGGGIGALMVKRCVVCSSENAESELFCARCTAPLGVVGLGELTEPDRARCLSALADVVAETSGVARTAEVRGGGGGGTGGDEAELFDAYLSAVWLRPETALVQFAEALAVRRVCRGQAGRVRGDWVDLGCGDGVHGALYSGFGFDADFDVFQAVDLGAKDLFDAFDPGEFVCRVTRRGRALVGGERGRMVGVDIKRSAVARARALGAWDEVVLADATALPMADGSVAGLFSNMLRDLGEPLPGALREVRRVLAPGGIALLSVMTPAYRDALYFAPMAAKALRDGDRQEAEQLLRLDRGRSVFCRQQLPLEAWRELLEAAGLRLVEGRAMVTAEVIRFWDVGLRPFSVPMIRQVRQWREAGVLGEVKPAILATLRLMLAGLRGRLLGLSETTPREQDVAMRLLVVTRP